MRRGCVGLLVVLSACARAEGGSAGVVERDSAGVRIVEVRVDSAGLERRWGMEAVPELTTDSADGGRGIELFRVNGIRRLDDGRLLIANGGSSELILVDPRTWSVRRYGRSGRGPGESVGIAGLWAGGGDTSYVYDLGNARVTPFTPAGGFGSPVPVPGGTIDGLVALRGRFADGSYLGVVVQAFTGRGEHEGVRSDSMKVVHVAGVTDSLRTLARLPFGQSWSRSSGGRGMIISLPFANGGFAAGWAGGYWLGETGRFELRRYDPSGRLEMVVRRDVPPRPVTRADLEREIASRTDGGGPVAAEQRRVLTEMPIPRQFPVIGRVLAAADGGLWVQDDPGGDRAAPPSWTAFGRDGRITARVSLPRGARLFAASGDRLAAVVEDDDEVEHVVLYRLQPARRGAGR